MRTEIVLDIETQNTFQDVGGHSPELLQISLIGCYFYETDSYETFLEEDLAKLWPRLERSDRIIGYNLFGFDYPCMQSYYTGDLMKLPTIDIMAEIVKRIGHRVKLDDVAHATLGIGKSGTGLMAVEYWRKGEIQKLADYCLQDVKVTREVYEYAMEQGKVSFFDRMGQKQDVPMPIAPPEPNVKPPINLSLGI
ncbi:ribonuclease H-like domain-containing protein [Patescibacteria group bacterium]|nr:ribonuclease H-like domain-containing protein [Patescibacteria group bacterium]